VCEYIYSSATVSAGACERPFYDADLSTRTNYTQLTITASWSPLTAETFTAREWYRHPASRR